MPAQLASSEQPKKSRGKRGGASNRKKALEKANKAAEAANEAAVKEALDAVKHNKDVLVTVASSTTNTTTATATAADGVLGSLGKKKRGRRGGAKNNSKKDFNADEAGDGETHEAAPTSAVTGNNNNNNNNNIIDPVVGVQTHRLPQLAPDVRDYFMVLESKLDLNSAAADHEADKGHEEEEEDQGKYKLGLRRIQYKTQSMLCILYA